MPKTRGGYTSAPQSSQRAAPVRAPLDAPPHLPDSAPQSRYHTRRASVTPVPLLRFHLGVLLQRKPRLQSPESPLEHLGIHSLSLLPPSALDPAHPSRATQIADPEHFMSRHILITLFSLDFYQSMTTRGVPVPPRSFLPLMDARVFWGLDRLPRLSISLMHQLSHAFRRWAHFLSGTWFVSYLEDIFPEDHFQEGASPGMLLVDVGYYFGPHHLIMAALLHFEEKVHKRRLTRAASIQLLFPRLLCHVLAHMGFHADPHSEPRRHCRESFSLDQWNQVSLHQHSPELPEPREVPPALSTSAPSKPVPEAASSNAPPTVPSTSEPPTTIPGAEYHALLASFQTLTTTQTTIMERMDHFQLQ
ncbi:hypothetical protein CK203_062555 [Vitis vinifera]|uniref:Uncharacterized protein n=1 Tax=Vitis vinifera TaxID=29760 RepID=A0A438FYH7_VITVI|nr:hypothetical protein CK203_062555 [Vitis vinifera]